MDAEQHETDPETGTETPESAPEHDGGTETPGEAPDAGESDSEHDGDMFLFSRDYVEKLRRKSSGYRLRAQQAEEAAEQLRTELYRLRVDALGILADPTDLPYAAELLDDPEQLREAAEQLVQSKPHLRARRAGGNIGQHEHGAAGDGFSLLGALRAGT